MKKVLFVLSAIWFVTGCDGSAMLAAECDSAAVPGDSGVPVADAAPDAMPVPADATPEAAHPVGVVSNFGGPQLALLTPGADWHTLGTLNSTAFGGSVHFTSLRFEGGNIGAFESIALARDGIIVAMATPVGAGSFAIVAFSDMPQALPEGVRQSYEVWGRLLPADQLTGFYGAEIDLQFAGLVAQADDGAMVQTFWNNSGAEFRLWQSFPTIAGRALATTTLANSAQDLCQNQISAVPTGNVTIGSSTYRLIGSHGSFADFRVRVGATELASGLYHVYRTGTTDDLVNGTVDLGVTGPVEVTVVFVGGLTISGSGQVVTLSATSSGFVAGDRLIVMFGDRTFFGISGGLTPEGLIDDRTTTLGPLTDAMVWTDGTRADRWTGSAGIQDLSRIETLTR